MVARVRVLAIGANGCASLELVGSRACQGCRGSCVGFMAPVTTQLPLAAAPRLSAGDEALISVPADDVLRGALWLHGGPWAGLLAGAAAGAATGLGDLACLIGAIAGFGAALGGIRRWHNRVHEHATRRLRVALAA